MDSSKTEGSETKIKSIHVPKASCKVYIKTPILSFLRQGFWRPCRAVPCRTVSCCHYSSICSFNSSLSSIFCHSPPFVIDGRSPPSRPPRCCEASVQPSFIRSSSLLEATSVKHFVRRSRALTSIHRCLPRFRFRLRFPILKSTAQTCAPRSGLSLRAPPSDTFVPTRNAHDVAVSR